MRVRAVPLLVLVAAAASLIASVGWTFAQANDGGWTMNRYGSGMMGLSTSSGGQPIEGLDDARRQAQRFADQLDLKTGEVMQFERNYYVELVEQGGRLATEVLVDPTAGSVWLEYGPAMMWNTRYGMMSDFRTRGQAGMMGSGRMMGAGMSDGLSAASGMGSGGMMGGGGGMMGGGTGGGMMGGTGGSGMMDGDGLGGGMMDDGSPATPSAPRETGRVSAAEAEARAQAWLDQAGEGLTAGDAEAFPGYYTLHTLRDGEVTGMLSVNETTGAVWFHWWHGDFVSMSE